MIARALRRTAASLAGALTLAAALAVATASHAPAASADNSGGLLPVPVSAIARGELITEDKLTEKHFYFDPTRPLSVLTDPSHAVGKEARRHLPAGKPIPKNAFRTHELIKRGRVVKARYRVGNLTIATMVLPQQSGGIGDLIRARNIDSGREITGVIGPDGVLEVAGQ